MIQLIMTKKNAGFAYFEVLLSIILICITLLPVTEALHSATVASASLLEGEEQYTPALSLQQCLSFLMAQPLEIIRDEINRIAQSDPKITTSPECKDRSVLIAYYDGVANRTTTASTGLVLLRVGLPDKPSRLLNNLMVLE